MIKKAAEATGDLVWNEITDRITKDSVTLPKNNSKTNEKVLREDIYLQI